MVQSNSCQSSLSTVKQEILKEALHHVRKSSQLAHRSAQVALGTTVIGTVVSLIGVGLLLAGHASAGTVTTASGLASSAGLIQLTKEASDRHQDANERLDKLVVMLDAETE